MAQQHTLDIQDLEISFGSGVEEVEIIKKLSLSVPAGSIVTIVGESGCGKSVTAHSVMQLLPSSGRIKGGSIILRDADGNAVDLAQLAPNESRMRRIRGQRLGMIFQDTMSSLNPVQTVGRQVVEKLLLNTDMSKQDAKQAVIDMFARLGIPSPERRFAQYPHEFSGGMRQRVMIAMAMICDPDLIIADEPTTALDVTIQAQIVEILLQLAKQRDKSIILITHNMGLVAEMADFVAVMYMGRIVELGPVRDIFANPTHPYTQALLASVPVLNMDRDTPLTTIAGATPSPHELGASCDFADRCPFVHDICLAGVIPMYAVDANHEARCVLVKEGKGAGNGKV
jgi:peptide/nickel transport system ATP-binding protein